MPNAFDYFLRGIFGKWKSEREGVDVRPAGRDEIKYTENDHSMIVYAELWTGKIEKAIYLSSIDQWLPPHENEVITDEDRKRIIGEICSYFDYYGTTYELVERA